MLFAWLQGAALSKDAASNVSAVVEDSARPVQDSAKALVQDSAKAPPPPCRIPLKCVGMIPPKCPCRIPPKCPCRIPPKYPRRLLPKCPCRIPSKCPRRIATKCPCRIQWLGTSMQNFRHERQWAMLDLSRSVLCWRCEFQRAL